MKFMAEFGSSFTVGCRQVRPWPGFVLINVHTRGPVKDFQVCIQADTKKVEKPMKCASRVKYLRLVTFTAV